MMREEIWGKKDDGKNNEESGRKHGNSKKERRKGEKDHGKSK